MWLDQKFTDSKTFLESETMVGLRSSGASQHLEHQVGVTISRARGTVVAKSEKPV